MSTLLACKSNVAAFSDFSIAVFIHSTIDTDIFYMKPATGMVKLKPQKLMLQLTHSASKDAAYFL